MENFNRVRLQIALGLAGVGIAVSIVGWLLQFAAGIEAGAVIAGVGTIMGWAAYLFGGLLSALKITWDIATYAFRAFYLPYSLIAFIFTAAAALFVVMFFPIVAVYRSYEMQAC